MRRAQERQCELEERRGSAHPGSRRSWSRGGRSREGRPRQHLAGGGGAGGRRWVRKAGPQTIVPTGLQCPGGPESGRAGARSPIRAADTVLRPGVAGGRGRWRGGRRAAAPPGRRASCRGPRARGTLLGGAPSAGRGAPSWAPRFLWSAGLAAGCWEPSGVWLDVPAEPGGLSGAGLRQLEVGYPLERGRGGAPHQGTQPRPPSPGF